MVNWIVNKTRAKHQIRICQLKSNNASIEQEIATLRRRRNLIKERISIIKNKNSKPLEVIKNLSKSLFRTAKTVASVALIIAPPEITQSSFVNNAAGSLAVRALSSGGNSGSDGLNEIDSLRIKHSEIQQKISSLILSISRNNQEIESLLLTSNQKIISAYIVKVFVCLGFVAAIVMTLYFYV
ncbi:hypothetical protein GCM10027046_39420 [Uliginosibacterium flavum]|uniref:Uncharacterized protein n=1 Tax=Uliginosibacterium flavum TaxID=1396831 RepID=A0ABV2TKK9_9RHOO